MPPPENQSEPVVEFAGWGGLGRLLVRPLVIGLLKVVYRWRVIGRENLPGEGPALLVSNHVSYIDALLIGAVARRRWVRFVISREFLHKPVIGPLVRFCLTVPVSVTRAKEAMKSTVEALRDGSLVCIFPEGQLTRHGALNPLKRGFELIARNASAPVVPVWLDQIWGSVFSFQGRKFFRKRPRQLPYRVSVWVGAAIPAREAGVERVEAAWRELSVQALAGRPELRRPLDMEVLRALRRRTSLPCLIAGGRRWSRGEVLALASLLAMRWRRWPLECVTLGGGCPARRCIAAIALVLAGKVPVFLSEAEADAALLSPEALEREWARLPRLRLLLRRRFAAWPVDWTRQEFSPGEAVAVSLPGGDLLHRTLLAQVQQLAGTNLLVEGDVLRHNVSLSRPAGQILFWHALLQGCPVVFDPAGGPPPSCWLTEEAADGDAGPFRLVPGENLLEMTEPPAVIACSHPVAVASTATAEPQRAAKSGTFGRLLPGISLHREDSRTLLCSPAFPEGRATMQERLEMDEDGLVRFSAPGPPAPDPPAAGPAAGGPLSSPPPAG